MTEFKRLTLIGLIQTIPNSLKTLLPELIIQSQSGCNSDNKQQVFEILRVGLTVAFRVHHIPGRGTVFERFQELLTSMDEDLIIGSIPIPASA